MGAELLACKLGCRSIEARDLLRLHRQSYPRFWAWIDDVVSSAYAWRYISTTFGWAYRPPIDAKPSSLMNWQMQSHGAEMLRLACCLATEAGLQIGAPVHDALGACGVGGSDRG